MTTRRRGANEDPVLPNLPPRGPTAARPRNTRDCSAGACHDGMPCRTSDTRVVEVFHLTNLLHPTDERNQLNQPTKPRDVAFCLIYRRTCIVTCTLHAQLAERLPGIDVRISSEYCNFLCPTRPHSRRRYVAEGLAELRSIRIRVVKK